MTRTLPGSWYGDEALHARTIERVFVPSWQVGPALDPDAPAGAVVPWRLGPGTVDEPVISARGEDGAWVTLSNVCTHRGAVLVDRPCRVARLRCPYHGRRFGLDGVIQAAPGFPTLPEGADLPSVRTTTVGPLLLASLGSPRAVPELVGPAWERLAPLLARPMVAAAELDAAYELDVSWALYVENYLEGLHVPFVHPELAAAIDLGAYGVEVLPGGVLQVAEAADGEAIALPAGHPDASRRMAAYYLWLFPDLMLNVYPWGLSLNHVQPIGPRRTRVVYRSFVADAARLGRGAGGDLHRVEAQDQAVVQRVQAGVGARLYGRGTYAPGHEDGVRAFHQWWAERVGPPPA